MTLSSQHIAQSVQLVRLRALRADLAARALARARAALDEAELGVSDAQACVQQAGLEHQAARAAIARATDMLPARLDHLRARALAVDEAALALEGARVTRDEAAANTRAAARVAERERARHERLDSEVRTLRRSHQRLREDRAADADADTHAIGRA